MLADTDTGSNGAPERSGWGWSAGDVCVLVVSDSAAWGGQMAARLAGEGYGVVLDDGRVPHSTVVAFHLAVIDMGLTVRSAAEVLAGLRERSSVPILAVSPEDYRSTMILDVYEAGADQLVTGAVGARELVARVRALLRRSPPQPPQEDGASLEIGALTLDVAAGALVVAGEKVRLTADELSIVHALIRRPGTVVHREDLAVHLPGGHPGALLDAVVRQVRNKLEAVEGWRRIETVRGVGFRLAPDAERGAWDGPDDPLEGLACA